MLAVFSGHGQGLGGGMASGWESGGGFVSFQVGDTTFVNVLLFTIRKIQHIITKQFIGTIPIRNSC